MPYFYYVVFFIFGTAFGSFLNVASGRYDPGRNFFSLRNVRGRSRCPHCGETLRWFELVPLLSFFLQVGKCRHCKTKLSFRYPVAELLSGAIFSFVPLFLYHHYQIAFSAAAGGIPLVFFGISALWIMVFLIWLAIALVDLKFYIVPDELNIALAGLGIGIVALKHSSLFGNQLFSGSFLRHYASIFSFTDSLLVNHVLGALAGSLFFWLLMVLSRGSGIGFGDVKLAFSSGLILGWPDIALALIIAFIAGSIVGIVLIFRKQKSMKDKVPFAPFLVFGFATVFFFGFQIVKWYFQLFNL